MIRKHYRLTGLALALVIAALLAPAASAKLDEFSPRAQPALQRQQVDPPPSLPHGVDYSAYDVGKPSTPPSDIVLRRDGAKAEPFVARVGPETSTASGDGFDWGDAGIGAGAGFALTMIGLGGLLVLSNRRHRAEQPAPTA